MRYEDVYASLKSFVPPEDWPGHLFMLPEEAVRDIYRFIARNRLRSCIELGTCFGTTACAIAAAVDEIGGGRVVTVDRYLNQPVNVKVLMQHVGLSEDAIDVVVDELGYTWYLADLVREQTHNGVCTPLFDFCLLDGAHEWRTDALAFFLIAKLLRPGGWIAVDDIDFRLRMMPDWRESHGSCTDRELDAFQMKMVYELAVRQHPAFCDFRLTHGGRIGWARKKTNLLKRIFRQR